MSGNLRNRFNEILKMAEENKMNNSIDIQLPKEATVVKGGKGKFLAKKIRHNKRKKAAKMLQICQDKIPYQKFKLAVAAYLRSDFDESIQYFNSAELDADEKLKKNILSKRKSFSYKLLDKIEIHKNEISIIKAKNLAKLARALYPNSNKYSEVMGNLYMDKAAMDTKIGNFSGAINIYEEAQNL